MQAPFTSPLVVSCGLGVDSVGMLVGYWQHGIRPDAILFAHVGDEKRQTYEYLPKLQAWLRAVGFPEVTVIQYKPSRFKYNRYETLAGNCLANATLPSLAFGRHGCSLKWKVEPMDKWVAKWAPARAAWASGLKVQRAIGYDCSPADSKRFAHADSKEQDERYEFVYPLRQWGWDREETKRQILSAGLDLPVKSACFFCPASKPEELAMLEPWQLKTIVAMETRAMPELRTVGGLWRKATKVLPAAMTDYIVSNQLLPTDEVSRIKSTVPMGRGNQMLDSFIENELIAPAV